MNLRILVPTHVLLERPVDKVAAEALDGQFCVLPRHIDLAAALVPGILVHQRGAEPQRYVGVDEGVLVKVGDEVLVSVRQAIQGTSLENLEERVEEEFRQLDEHERKARSAAAKLEAGLVRRFLDVKEQPSA